MKIPFGKKATTGADTAKAVPQKAAQKAADAGKKIKDTAGKYTVDGVTVGGVVTTKGAGVGTGVSIRKKKR